MAPASPGDSSGDPFTFQYPPDTDDQPLLAIVESVAWVKGVDARELDPLHSVIDVDTLTDLLGRERPEFDRSPNDPSNLTVTFRYEGCLVTVRRGHIAVELE